MKTRYHDCLVGTGSILLRVRVRRVRDGVRRVKG